MAVLGLTVFFAWEKCLESSPLDDRTYICQPRHLNLFNSSENTSSFWIMVEGAGYYHVLNCLLLCATVASRSGRHTHLYIVERNSPTPFQRRLSLTNVSVGKNITGGTKLTSAMKGVFLALTMIKLQ